VSDLFINMMNSKAFANFVLNHYFDMS